MTLIKKGYAESRFGQVHYRTANGPAGSGAPILLFHRTPVTSASFDAILKRLGDWRRIIAFDTPGFGESFTPDTGTGMSEFVTAFVDAIDSLNIDEFHLAGHHTGAHFATEIALAHPDRALSLLIDGAMVPSAEERARAAPPPPAIVVDDGGTYAAGVWAFLRPYYTIFDERCIHDEFVGALRSTFTRDACMAVVRAHDMSAILGAVRCPLMASAAQDDVFVAHLDRIKQAAPGAVTRIYGPAGIASPALQTEAFCDLIRTAVALGEN